MNAFQENFLEHDELGDYKDSEMLEGDFELDLELDELELTPQEFEAEVVRDHRSRVPQRTGPQRPRPLPAGWQRYRPQPAGGRQWYRQPPAGGWQRFPPQPARPRWGFVDEPVSSSPERREEYIRWVQSTLNDVAGLRLPVDGIMGPEVRSAVRSFQQRQGLPITGLVGPDTERALIAAKSRQSPGAGAVKLDEPGPTEPAEPAATPSDPVEPATPPPATEFDFEWETLDDAFEDAYRY